MRHRNWSMRRDLWQRFWLDCLGGGSELVFTKRNQRRFSYIMKVGQLSFLDLEIVQCWLHLRRSKIWQNRAGSEVESVLALLRLIASTKRIRVLASPCEMRLW